jgi:divalent metal cation (Fe/Co/Zn/Cd) transporter
MILLRLIKENIIGHPSVLRLAVRRVLERDPPVITDAKIKNELEDESKGVSDDHAYVNLSQEASSAVSKAILEDAIKKIGETRNSSFLMGEQDFLRDSMIVRLAKDKKISDSLEAMAGAVTLTSGIRPVIAFLSSVKVLNSNFESLKSQFKQVIDNVYPDPQTEAYIEAIYKANSKLTPPLKF